MFGCGVFGTTRYVPAGGNPSYSTIQDAIDVSSDGDIIIVANGIYSGSGFKNITVNKAITIKSANGPQNCTIDNLSGLDSQGFILKSNCIIEGFTIKRKGGSIIFGGAVVCEKGNPTIRNCVINENHASEGGGIYVGGGSPLIIDCIISNNKALNGGGGIRSNSSLTRIENCIISNNESITGHGGGIAGQCSYIKSSLISYNKATGGSGGGLSQGADLVENSIISHNIAAGCGGIISTGFSPTIRNCTIAYNGGAGVYAGTNSSPQIFNCILWGNGDDLYNAWSIYSCVEDGDAGDGNISSDPLFANPTSNDFHLKSMGGRWNGSSWVIDSVSSPCIDAGNPTSICSLEPSPNGGRINMGAYGNTSQASKSGYYLTLSLINPNGGQVLSAGDICPITWSSNLSVGTILIEYSLDNGGSWTPVSPANNGNTGSYDWLVPEISSEECLVRISDTADPSVNDVSEGLFTICIPTLNLIRPNGGEVLLKNNPYEIRWSSNYPLDNVVIEYSTNNGLNWWSVIPPNTGNTGSYIWSVPETVSDECLLRITDASDTEKYDISDNLFEIGGCSIIGDLDGNCYVDLSDFAILASNWLKSEPVRIYTFNLDNNPLWAVEGEWQFGQPIGDGGTHGNPDPNSGYTGFNVFGVNLNGDYSTAVGGPYRLIAGPFDCTQYRDIKLKYSRWLNSDAPAYVASKVEASNNGSDWSVIWEASGASDITDDNWQDVEYYVGSVADGQDSVYIRWSYQILDSRAYPYSGWNIDDIQLWGSR